MYWICLSMYGYQHPNNEVKGFFIRRHLSIYSGLEFHSAMFCHFQCLITVLKSFLGFYSPSCHKHHRFNFILGYSLLVTKIQCYNLAELVFSSSCTLVDPWKISNIRLHHLGVGTPSVLPSLHAAYFLVLA